MKGEGRRNAISWDIFLLLWLLNLLKFDFLSGGWMNYIFKRKLMKKWVHKLGHWWEIRRRICFKGISLIWTGAWAAWDSVISSILLKLYVLKSESFQKVFLDIAERLFCFQKFNWNHAQALKSNFCLASSAPPQFLPQNPPKIQSKSKSTPNPRTESVSQRLFI